MKQRLCFIMILLMIFLSGCSSSPSNVEGVSSEGSQVSEKETPVEENKKQTMSIKEFEELLLTQPVAVIKTKYVIQDETYKALYPDMLQAIIKNNTSSDIKDVVVAFVAWDENDLPLKIKGDMDFSDGSYIKLVNYEDINLASQGSFGEDSGYSVDENLNIDSFKAIVVSYETFEGDTWDNPYYKYFETLYEGEKFNPEATIEVEIVEVSKDEVAEGKEETEDKEETKADSQDKVMSYKEQVAALEANLASQPLVVTKTKFLVQDENYKALYPDMLQAIFKNNTTDDIKDAVIAFVAWDENNLPVKIKGSFDFKDGTYIRLVNYSDINLVGGKTYGDNGGFEIDENLNIKHVKAIAVSYETFDGETWENPHFDEFEELFSGKKLSE